MHDRRIRSALFYSTMAVALLVLVVKGQQLVLPSGLATQIGHNSEAFLFAILVAAQIQILRTRVRTPRLLIGMTGCGALMVVLGLALRESSLPPTVTTLNEPVIGAGFLLFYLCLPRSRTTALLSAVSVTLFIVVLSDTAFVIDQAESLVPLVLAGPAFDIVDRRLLIGDASGTKAVWMSWVVGLTLLAVLLIPVGAWARADLSGAPAATIDYLRRAIEGYWGWVFVHVYFAFLLGVAWRNSRSADERPGSGPPSPASQGAVTAPQG